MKYLLTIVASIAFASIICGQSNPTVQEEKAVKQLIIDSFQGLFSDLDSTKIEKYCTQDFLLLEHGEVWTNDTLRNYLRKALTSEVIPKRENRFEFIKFEKYGNSIWVAYDNYAVWTVDGAEAGRMHWLESAVAIKENQVWKLKMLHSTRIENEQ